VICPSCGRSLDPTTSFCRGCGAAVGAEVTGKFATPARRGRSGDVLVAVLLALVLPGMGYVYLGRALRALVVGGAFYGCILGIVALLLSSAFSIPAWTDVGDIVGGLVSTFLWIVVLAIAVAIIFIFQLVDTAELAGERRGSDDGRRR